MPLVITKWTKADGKTLNNEEISRVREPIDEKNDPFARQKLVDWWDQDKISSARVLVMGAGAIGNETLKNLALLGFRQIFICDMDTIELSNLSRTLLFRPSDEGREKAAVAAERVREMCLASDPRVDYFTGDIMFSLGVGIFRYFDIILGCLDNDATRFYIDKYATVFGKPWINAGISGLFAGFQPIFSERSGTCFHCGVEDSVITKVMSRKASCGKTAIADLSVGKIPTIQVASAIVSGWQTQETVKYITGKDVAFGNNYYFDGAGNNFTVSHKRPDSACRHHDFPRIREVKELHDVTSVSTMADLLASAKRAIGKSVTVDLSEEMGRDFIPAADCVYCGNTVKIGVPHYRFRDEMAVCPACRANPPAVEAMDPWVYPVTEYSEESDPALLAMTLDTLGIPPLHVLRVYDEDENVYYVELTGDLPIVCPQIFGKFH